MMHTKKSYMASLCHYFKKSTLNPTSSNITHFQKFNGLPIGFRHLIKNFQMTILNIWNVFLPKKMLLDLGQ